MKKTKNYGPFHDLARKIEAAISEKYGYETNDEELGIIETVLGRELGVGAGLPVKVAISARQTEDDVKVYVCPIDNMLEPDDAFLEVQQIGITHGPALAEIVIPRRSIPAAVSVVIESGR